MNINEILYALAKQVPCLSKSITISTNYGFLEFFGNDAIQIQDLIKQLLIKQLQEIEKQELFNNFVSLHSDDIRQYAIELGVTEWCQNVWPHLHWEDIGDDYYQCEIHKSESKNGNPILFQIPKFAYYEVC